MSVSESESESVSVSVSVGLMDFGLMDFGKRMARRYHFRAVSLYFVVFCCVPLCSVGGGNV